MSCSWRYLWRSRICIRPAALLPSNEKPGNRPGDVDK